MRKILYPLSLVYNFISELKRKRTKRVRLYRPVISVGNITWGGSGKTPVVAEVAKYIMSLGKTPVILSRGYRRKIVTEEPVVVRDGEKILSSLEMAGDEPYMLAGKLECPVIIGPDRVKSAEAAKRYNPDVFILDDGFQHWKLERELDIVCVNAVNPFGNGMIIPAGILRENIKALKRAGLTVVTNSDCVTAEKLGELDEIIYGVCGKKAVYAGYGNFKIQNIAEEKLSYEPQSFKNRNVFMVCAVGSPENFKKTLGRLGLSVKKEFIFRDHYEYLTADIKNICAKMKDADMILTTEKDAVKIKEVIEKSDCGKIFVLRTGIVFGSGRQEFENKIAETLK